MIKSMAGSLSYEGSADRNNITDDTNNFSTEMTQKCSNRKCRRNFIQKFNDNEESRWKNWKIQASAATNLRQQHRPQSNESENFTVQRGSSLKISQIRNIPPVFHTYLNIQWKQSRTLLTPTDHIPQCNHKLYLTHS